MSKLTASRSCVVHASLQINGKVAFEDITLFRWFGVCRPASHDSSLYLFVLFLVSEAVVCLRYAYCSTCSITILFNMFHHHIVQHVPSPYCSTCSITILFNMFHHYIVQHVPSPYCSTCSITILFNMFHHHIVQHVPSPYCSTCSIAILLNMFHHHIVQHVPSPYCSTCSISILFNMFHHHIVHCSNVPSPYCSTCSITILFNMFHHHIVHCSTCSIFFVMFISDPLCVTDQKVLEASVILLVVLLCMRICREINRLP